MTDISDELAVIITQLRIAAPARLGIKDRLPNVFLLLTLSLRAVRRSDLRHCAPGLGVCVCDCEWERLEPAEVIQPTARTERKGTE